MTNKSNNQDSEKKSSANQAESKTADNKQGGTHEQHVKAGEQSHKNAK